MAKCNLTDLNSDEYNQGLCYFQLTVSLDRCNGRCNTLNDLSNRTYVLNKTEDANLSVFNMITRKK